MNNKDLIIEERTKQILEFLQSKKSPEQSIEVLREVLKMYKYVVQNINLGAIENKFGTPSSREDAYKNELVKGLTNNTGLPTTNSIALNHLLNSVNIENYIAILKSRTGGNHVASLIKLDSEYYYFDPTLERSNYEDQYRGFDEFPLSFAALGKEDYERIYKPVRIMASMTQDVTKEIKPDIAEKSISRTLINSISRVIPHLAELSNKDNRNRDEDDEELVQ